MLKIILIFISIIVVVLLLMFCFAFGKALKREMKWRKEVSEWWADRQPKTDSDN